MSESSNAEYQDITFRHGSIHLLPKLDTQPSDVEYNVWCGSYAQARRLWDC